MKDSRHPHPHLDPRQPRDATTSRSNPPVFAWKPRDGQRRFHLQVARNPEFSDLLIDRNDLQDPLHLPERALPPDTYWWRWSADGETSQVFTLTIGEDAVIAEIPSAATWLERLHEHHPRIYLSPEAIPGLRAAPPPQWPALRNEAEAQMRQAHQIAEPELLPSREDDYAAFWKIWYPTMWGTRRFVKGAETLALAWLLSGEDRYGRAACRRMASIAQWDPEGSSHLSHNDEAHMSVIWHGSHVCDWVWDLFSESERAQVIKQFKRRGEITFEHMHDKGHYGIDRFDSHAGREIVFLAQLSLVFHEHIPEAVTWLEWLRPVLCGLWPSWAGDDGAWAQGPSYGLAYVTIMTMFASALKRGTGVDLYRRPFWQNHARWRQWCLPPYAEWMGFGDHSERWASSWNNNADLVELIGRETDTGEFNDYVADFRRIAENLTTPPERKLSGVNAQLLLAPTPTAKEIQSDTNPDSLLRVFADTGWAALRSNRNDPERDIAFIFRSSPYGSISHSHANNNDFILHAGGRVLAMPSGYYAGYGSGHHAHWVWHTKSHNCLTLSDAPQLMRSPESVGQIAHAFENEHLVYFCGIADASYQDRATRCRRHVVFLKGPQCFAMVDEFIAREKIVSALQWNIHSWNPFAVDENQRTFSLEREHASLTGHFLWGGNGFFSLSEGWDPPPMTDKGGGQWAMQYHLRYTPVGLIERRNLGIILCPGHKHLEKAAVQTRREDGAEIAQIGTTELKVFGEADTNAVAQLQIEGTQFTIGDQGLVSP